MKNLAFPRCTVVRVALLLACVLAQSCLAEATLDTNFNPQATGWVQSLALQGDRKIVVGGGFTTLGGQSRVLIGRLNPDGALDSAFNPGAGGSQPYGVYSLVAQEDGKILVGGDFETLGGQPRRSIGRLREDGTLDYSFNPGVDMYVYCLKLQENGKILVGGDFTMLAGQSSTNLGRLNPDGTLDTSFDPGPDYSVNTIALQEDGKILVGGDFRMLGGQSRSCIGRLNPDGSLDTSFNPVIQGSFVNCLVIQADGKILVGGQFTMVDGQSRNNLARLNADGSLDTTIKWGASSYVNSLALQADGKILAGGRFTSLGGQTRKYIGRLNADGSLDATFNPGADSTYYPEVYSVALQTDGAILAGGNFTKLAGQACKSLGRLHNTDPATQLLSFNGSTITWLRGGTSPEVWRTRFYASTNGGSQWMDLGNGTRIAGGWQVTGLNLPTNSTIRARGYSTGGYHNSSSSIEESYAGPVVVLRHPLDRTNNAGTTASFTVQTWNGNGGTNRYQWFKNGTNLVDGANIGGAQTAMLVLTNVFKADEGNYTVVVSNTSGSATSVAARLTVVDPLMLTPPAGIARNRGESAAFTVVASGTAPLSYQWLKDGAVLSDRTTSSLTLTNLGASDIAFYNVVITNQWGSVTSVAVPLVVNCTDIDAFYPRIEGAAPTSVYSLAIQRDGKVLIGGNFTVVGGRWTTNFCRLNADGSLDATFNTNIGFPGYSRIYSLAVQTDGRILIGGFFTTLCGQPRRYIGRLNSDGTLDTSFAPEANDVVNCIAVEPDGKILAGGAFGALGGWPRDCIGRLNSDGSLDHTFNPELWSNLPNQPAQVNALIVQADSKILIGGRFTSLCGQPRANLGRLNPDGTLDVSFNPGTDGIVRSLAIQADGKILVGGEFTNLANRVRMRIGRLNVDGSLDLTFDPGAEGGYSPAVSSLVVQADGRIVVGGSFTNLAGQSRQYIGRLNADGSLDNSFNPQPKGAVGALALQSDGRLLVGGSYTGLLWSSSSYLARLQNTEPAIDTLRLVDSRLTWQRGGTSPEVLGTIFEVSTNAGGDWGTLGNGKRTAQGWELAGVALPVGATVRARGRVPGAGSESSWSVDSFLGPPAISFQPLSRTNNARTVASFSVQGWSGTGEANSYQWRKGETDLMDAGNIEGAQNPTLVLTNVLKIDEGGYSVVISNTSGCLTSVVAQLTIVDPLILSQPTNLARIPGESASFAVSAEGTPMLKYQWLKEGIPLMGETSSLLNRTNLNAADAGYYSVAVSNEWGSVTSEVAVLSVNMVSRDGSFNPNVKADVRSIALQPDGKILVGGDFEWMGAQSCYYLGRLNPAGTVDTSFKASADYHVHSLALQASGNILVGGAFSALNAIECNFVGRLNSLGDLDKTFYAAANDNVQCVSVQPDGKIVVAGYFVALNGDTRNFVGRLNADGTIDPNWGLGASGPVHTLAIQSDGKILIGGQFAMLGGQSRSNIARLNPDGTLDSAFNPGANATVLSFAVQANGKILAGGDFTMICGQSCSMIARLNPDGSLDSTFNSGANNSVSSLALQADGRILAGGRFTTLSGASRSHIGRLNSDGSLDCAFNPGTDGDVSSLVVQANGDILVGGSFTSLAGQSCSYLGRLKNTELATQHLMFDGSRITWLRGGGSPEVMRTAFEVSTNSGANWLPLGQGKSITGGWELAGLDLPEGSTIRATGYQDGPGWFCESFLGPQAIVSHSLSQTTNAGATVSFTVHAWNAGATNSIQWQKNGTNLLEDANVVGTRNSTLILSNVLKYDEGSYRAVTTNASGSLTSAPAQLWVQDPFVTPLSFAGVCNLGDQIAFAVDATGTRPLNYQWFRNGALLVGQTNSMLILDNVVENDFGVYSAEVSNQWGSVMAVAGSLTLRDGAVDPGFNPSPNGTVYALAAQVDGKTVLGGSFSTLAGTQSQNNIARLNQDGSLDSGFNPGANAVVSALAIQADGKIIVAGAFGILGGQTRYHLGRLKIDGTLDGSFDPRANFPVSTLAIQADGKILVGGRFTALCDQTRNFIGRLNPDGTLDTTFNPGANGAVKSITLQSDGKILVGGDFTELGGQRHNFVGRLNIDGTVDSSFNPGASGSVKTMAAQPDGKILVGGDFILLNGWRREHLGRLNSDGTIDTLFDPPGAWGMYSSVDICSVTVQPDGKILVGGEFYLAKRNNLCRLNSDGSLDASFSPYPNSWVAAIAIQSDGGVVVGGNFTVIDEQPHKYIARLNSNGPMLPRIASVAPSLGLSDDGFGFNFTGVAGSFVVIEGSPDLENWSPIQTNFLNTSVSTFRDPAVTNTPTRYYRVKVQQP